MKVRTPGAVQGMMFALIMPLSFASNVFVGADTLPGWMQAFVKVNPMTHLVGVGARAVPRHPARQPRVVDARLVRRLRGGVHAAGPARVPQEGLTRREQVVHQLADPGDGRGGRPLAPRGHQRLALLLVPEGGGEPFAGRRAGRTSRCGCRSGSPSATQLAGASSASPRYAASSAPPNAHAPITGRSREDSASSRASDSSAAAWASASCPAPAAPGRPAGAGPPPSARSITPRLRRRAGPAGQDAAITASAWASASS